MKKMKFPIEHVKENIIFTKTECFAGFKINGFEYSSRSREGKIAVWENIQELIKGIPSKAKILLIPRKKKIKDSINPMLNKIDKNDPLYDSAEVLIEDTIEVLEERSKDRYEYDEDIGEEVFVKGEKDIEYDNYLFISIKEGLKEDFIANSGEILEYLIKEPAQGINKVLGVAEKYVTDTRFKFLKKKSKEFLEEQKLFFDIRELSKKEIDSLVERITKRGHESANENISYSGKDGISIKENNENVFIPIRDRYKNRVKGKIVQGNKMIKVVHDDFTSYQSFITVVDLPSLAFPDGELIKKIQDEYCCEICIDIKKLSEDESKRTINTKDKKISAQINEAEQGGHEVTEDVIEAKISSEEFSRELRESKHVIETSISLCIASTDEEKVRNEVKEIIKTYKTSKVSLVAPYTDQYKLFLDFIPGVFGFCKDFKSPMSVRTLAGLIPFSNDKLGNKKGVYIGYTRTGRKIYLYLGEASQQNKSPAMIIIGNPGYGKSFNANLMLLLHVLTGSSAIIFDPKSERSHWKKELDFMEELISIVRLTSSDEDAGKLDPFNVYRDNINEACELALNIVCELTGIKATDRSYIVLKETLAKMKDEEKPCMERLTELLETMDTNDLFYEDAYQLARQLKTMKDVGLSRLIFGNGNEDAISLENRINILQIDKLKIPSVNQSKEDYSEEERLSTCLMMIMGNFTKKFALSGSSTFDIGLFDEAWFLKSTTEGRKLFEYLSRNGRSLNFGCIFNGHSVLDIPSEEVRNTLTYKLCFHTESRDEAKRMLELLNMDISEDNIKLLKGLKNGEALFQDLDGRVGVVIFDAIFERFIKCFDTTPKDTMNKETA